LEGTARPFEREGVNTILIELTENEAAKSPRNMPVAYSEVIESSHQELKNAHVALLEMSKMKDQFLSSMSHELRTPLNVILGLSDVMIQGLYGDLTDEQRENLSLINDSGRHLLELVNGILDVAKIASGQERMEFTHLSIDVLCQNVISMFRVQAQKRNHEILFETKGSDFDLNGDERRIAQILLNLLSNASKFTAPGKQIGLVVTGQPESKVIQIDVWDEGAGIPQDKIKLLFEPFVQLDDDLAREHEGTGLGLSLVKQLVELHAGQISVRSAVGEGTSFSVLLPRENADAS
jgi:signal transduction histidine kinase